MQLRLIQTAGLVWTIVYAAFVIWIYATQPRSLREVATNTQVAAGTYQVDQEKFNNALGMFRREQFRAARDEWGRADPGAQDAVTQLYIAYAFYREGWGRVYDDDTLFKQGLEAVNHAINVAPNQMLRVDDPDLQLHTAAELKAELEKGTEQSLGDLNPLEIFRKRK